MQRQISVFPQTRISKKRLCFLTGQTVLNNKSS
jgi:hypothetical protein